jgi:hypothetical protein
MRLTAGDDGRLTLIVEAPPGTAVKLTGPPDVDVVYRDKAPDSHKLH